MLTFDADGERWAADREFLTSRWTCIWGRGCLGIGETADHSHHFGCCSLGAELTDAADAANLSAHAACIPDELWQFADVARVNGIFAPDARRETDHAPGTDADSDSDGRTPYAATAVIDGGCIFLNREGFAAGAGCALHLAAIHHDEPPHDWKPNVCWELPLKIDNTTDDGGTPVTVLRRWQRTDFGADAEMEWFCTDTPDAYVGATRVIDSLHDELRDLMGAPAADALQSLLADDPATDGIPAEPE